jgi:hypothetical protein
MELGNEPESGGGQNQSEHDAGTASHCWTRSDGSEYGHQPIGTGESDWQGNDSATSCAGQPRSETHGKSLRLLIESVRNQKAIVKLQLQQLEEQERQLEKVLGEYEENLRGSAE